MAWAPAYAEEGVSDKRILFGQSAVLDGPAAALGQGMRLGILAAFDEANRRGGVHGRRLELKSVNDGYEPEAAIAQSRKLIEQDHVFALIGAVGTPTSQATVPIAMAAKVPFIGAFTGAAFLRDPKLEYVVNVRAGYTVEAETWLKHLTEDLKLQRIGILYQDDAFGRAGLDAVRAAMEARGMELAAEATFERNTTAVKTAVLTLRYAAPQAVLMIGTYKPCAEFIKLARRVGFNPLFVNISFVGATALTKELGLAGKGVVVSQVVPFPWDNSIKAVADYQAALKAEDPMAEPEFVSLEGYLVGRLAIAALDRAGPNPTRSGLIAAIKGAKKFDFGGLTMSFGPDRNVGLDRVFLTVIQGDGSFKPVDKLAM